jgi:hypothetical protein
MGMKRSMLPPPSIYLGLAVASTIHHGEEDYNTERNDSKLQHHWG